MRRKMKQINSDLSAWDKAVIWVKSKLYTILSVENLDKLTTRKDNEIKSLEIVKKSMHEDIRRELDEEFGDYYSEEEIDNMLKEIISE
jgi:hypothetical protein